MDRPLAQAPDSVKLCLKTHSEEATEKDMQTATPCLNTNYVGEHTCMHTHVHKHIQRHMFTYRHACVRVRTHAQHTQSLSTPVLTWYVLSNIHHMLPLQNQT